MSGSSSGYIPSSGENAVRPCKKLAITVILATPVPNISVLVKVRDVLEIVYVNPSLEAHDSNGEYIGTVLSASNPKIVECIEGGVDFVGIVQSIQGAKCTVLIKAIV
jgi:hypothetical protein